MLFKANVRAEEVDNNFAEEDKTQPHHQIAIVVLQKPQLIVTVLVVSKLNMQMLELKITMLRPPMKRYQMLLVMN